MNKIRMQLRTGGEGEEVPKEQEPYRIHPWELDETLARHQNEAMGCTSSAPPRLSCAFGEKAESLNTRLHGPCVE